MEDWVPPTSRTIGNVQRMFRDIYGERNRFRASWSRISNAIAQELGIVAEAIRKGDPDAPRGIAGLGARIFALANWFDWDLATLVARKYHGCCPYCQRKEYCGCPEAAEKKRFIDDVDSSLLVWTLDEWQSFFARLYGSNNTRDGRHAVHCHLSEELGEMIRAMRDLDQLNAQEEIADLFAWWLGYANVIGIESVSTLIYQVYTDRCPHCGQNPCPVNGPCLAF
ncbi:hypothetical protein HY733_01385 [Candidatus Uhrbacteria bacterium]|nr:hypothetical protein [Candidatus Uhrbacteria bacterium]